MSLFLFETAFSEKDCIKKVIKEKISTIQAKLTKKDAALIEVQVAKDFTHSFFIIETNDVSIVKPLIENEGLTVLLSKEVRLIGEDLDEVKQQKETVNYIVEWNLPENLTMEQYLNRKEKNSIHYAEVPEVSFARTYVCEDMTKCLCFYDAPNKQAVEKAREAVSAPIDVITELGENK